MKVLVVGASGFIGRHLVAALHEHEVRTPRVDYRRPPDWAALLQGVEVVINAAGVFRGSAAAFAAIHDRGPRRLFEACESAGVRRVVQISALGADAGARSRFHLSKRAADEDLAGRALDWAVVQPSLVYGADGASARRFLMLASLPVVPLPGDGLQQVQPIHIADLATLLVNLVEHAGRLHAVVPAVGPRPLALREYLASLRRQMGLGEARFLRVPLALVPIDREALDMLQRGNTASPDAIRRFVAPRDVERFVEGDARTRARLDWLLPLLRASIAIVWIASGVVSLGVYPVADSLAMLARVGLVGTPALVALYGAALLDIALGLASVLVRGRWLWKLQLGLILGYSIVIALRLPELWLHPFGPLVKNLPMLAAIVLLHELEQDA